MAPMLLVGILALGPGSPLFDVPYPEIAGEAARPSTPEERVAGILATYARALQEANRQALAETLHPEFKRVTIRRNGVRPEALEIATGTDLMALPPQPSRALPTLSQVKVDGAKASARLTFADHTELLHLVLLNREWRVLQSLAEPR